MNTYQITKRKLTKQPNKNLPNNQMYAYKRPKDGVLVVPIGCLKE